MKKALWLEVTCRDGRIWHVAAKKIIEIAKSNGHFMDGYEHERIMAYAKTLHWNDVSMNAIAYQSQIPVDYMLEWKERPFSIVEDLNSQEKEEKKPELKPEVANEKPTETVETTPKKKVRRRKKAVKKAVKKAPDSPSS